MSMDAERSRRLIAAAKRRPRAGSQQPMTAEELHDDLRAALERLTPPPPPDPLTGRTPTAG